MSSSEETGGLSGCLADGRLVTNEGTNERTRPDHGLLDLLVKVRTNAHASESALPDADFDRQKITFLAILKPSGDFYFFPDRQTISGEFLAILSLIWLEEFSKRSPDNIW